MVTLKEIQKVLDNLKGNIERIGYLKDLLGSVEDKELKNEIKFLIRSYEKVLELEAKSALSKEQWSNEDIRIEEPRWENLERQVVSMPSRRREERKEEIKYGVSHSDVTYAPHRMDYDPLKGKILTSLKEENLSFDERFPATDEQKHLIEERVRKYMPSASEERIHQEVGLISNQFHYESQKQSVPYSSLSEELHEKERKKPKF